MREDTERGLTSSGLWVLIVKYDTRFGRSGVILLIFAGECLGVEVLNLKHQSAIVNTCEGGVKSFLNYGMDWEHYTAF